MKTSLLQFNAETVPVCHHATRKALLLVVATVLTDGSGPADPDLMRMFILAERMRERAAAVVWALLPQTNGVTLSD